MSSYLKEHILPMGWLLTQIESVCTTPQYGYTTKASKEGTVKLLRTTDITKGKIDWQTVPFCNENPSDIDKYLLKEGDVVISRAGSIGVSYLIENPDYSVFASYLIRFNALINKKFFKRYLESPYYWESISDGKLGIALPNINASKLKAIEFPLPPLLEQERIAEKIEDLFAAIERGEEHLKNAQYQLKIYRQSILQKAFTGQLTSQWREENNIEPAEYLLNCIKEHRKSRYEKEVKDWKDSIKIWEKEGRNGKRPTKPKQIRAINNPIESDLEKLPIIPLSWKYSKLGFIGNIERGKSKHRPRNDSRLFGGSYPFIQTGEIRNSNVVIQKYDKTYSEFGLQQSKLWNKGTLCITIAANIAETAFLGFDACFPDSVVGFIPEPEVSDKYVFYFIEFSKKRIEKFAPATAQKNINLNILDNVYIPFCSIEEQNGIVKYIDNIFFTIDQLEENIVNSFNKADALRQSILKKAFEGKLVPQNPNDEPATELLKKIQQEKLKWQESQKAKKRISKPKTRMESLSIEEVLKRTEKPISPKELWETSKHRHDIEEFYLELKKLGDKVIEIKSETESLIRLENAN